MPGPLGRLFHLPKFTDEDLAAIRDEYVAEHGYSVHVPGFSDIIKIPVEKPMTQQEQEWWKKKEYDRFSPERIAEINWIKQKRVDRLKRMLASPTPDLVHNYASIMTSLDDAEDAITTFACVGRLIARVSPRMFAKVITRVSGWLMFASAIMDFCMALTTPMLICGATKRGWEALTSLNPASAKGKLKRAERLKRILPSLGEWLEALQVTDNLFGAGVCLGPIFGFAYDSAFGLYHVIKGDEVHWHVPSVDWPHYRRVAHKVLRHMPILSHFNEDFSLDDHRRILMAWTFALQAAGPFLLEEDPLADVQGFDNVELEAPRPWHILTIEALQEQGLDIEDNVGWPGSTRKRTTFKQIFNSTANRATDNFKRYCRNNRHDWYDYIFAMSAVSNIFHSLAHGDTYANLYWEETCDSKTYRDLHDRCLWFKKIIDDPTIEAEKARAEKTGIIRIPDHFNPAQKYYWASWTHQPGYPQPWFTLRSCAKAMMDGFERNCERETPLSPAYIALRLDTCLTKWGNYTMDHYALVENPIYPGGLKRPPPEAPIDTNYIFPTWWTKGDRYPTYLNVPLDYDWPDDWKVGDPLPEGVTYEPPPAET